MTPKEKANEIANAMYNGSVFDYDKQGHLKEIENAKRRALIVVDELIYETQFQMPNIRQRWWQDVKKHIQRL